ncbi:MAG TPA: Ig-like domain-containing protein, partial [Anaerolineae bacterium]|nr:Ig-like domain-containing protein [Anaerolineae bacterium]
SHTTGVWSNDPTIFVSWSGATDGSGSGVFGYSYVWDTSPGTLPDAAYDTTGSSATSPALGSGNNKYFHIRTRDVAGNWSATAAHRGPYYVDTTPPSSSASSPASTGSTSFLVSWTGSDANSGILNYDVQYKDISASGSWTTWKSATTLPSSTFTGLSGHIYQFRSRARDNAGNVEAYPAGYDSQTVIATLNFFVKNPGIEVNQGVQDLSNSVTLIASKRTFVRCYVQSASGTQPGVPARLRVYRGATLMGTLAPSNAGGTITLRTSPDRSDLNHAYYFDVPAGWLSAGSVRFECEVNTPLKYGENNMSDNIRSVTLSFVNAPAMNLLIVDVPYRIGGTTYHVRNLDRTRLAKWLRNAYPIRTLNVEWAYLDPPYNGLPAAATVNFDLFWTRIFNPNQFFNDGWARYYGMAIDTGGFMRGKAMGIPSVIASGPTGPTGGWDTDGSYGDWYGGHELGHTYGRKHVRGAPYAGDGKCGDEAGPDGSYPYGSGYISPGTSPWVNNTKYGLDWSDVGVRVITPLWYDVMTYCKPQWISDYTYEAIYSRMVAEKPVAASLSPQATTAAEHLVVTAAILTPTDVITLNTFYRLPNSEDLATSPPGDYHIRLLGAGDALLADHAITPYFSPEADEPEGAIAEMVPWVTGTQKIVITHGATALVTRTVSANAPVVTITSPNGGENLSGGEVTLTWTASDADGDALTFTIDYSRDGGATWESLSGEITATQATLDLSLLPGTTQGKFRVWVSDGVNTGSDASDGVFSVPLKLPEIISIEPPSGATYVVSQTVTFEGVAFDVEDGLLGDAQLQWSSSLQGPLGTGGLLQTADLIAGTHVVTLTATDSHNNVATATTTITVVDELPLSWIYLPIVLRN